MIEIVGIKASAKIELFGKYCFSIFAMKYFLMKDNFAFLHNLKDELLIETGGKKQVPKSSWVSFIQKELSTNK